MLWSLLVVLIKVVEVSKIEKETQRSNTQNVNGAAEILNQKAMDEIAEKLGGDFIVLPSSVHETIILPIDQGMDSNELEGMVQQINAGVVSDEDKLSDHVFQYDSESHELVRMDKMEERKQEKEASVEKTIKVRMTEAIRKQKQRLL